MPSIGVIIFLVIFVGGWLVKLFNAVNEKNKGKQSPQADAQQRQDYEALARRRQQELQAQALQRRAKQNPSAQASVRQPVPDPATMSMAERIELARRRAAQQRGGVDPQQQARALQQAHEQAQHQARAQQSQAERIQAERARQQRITEARQQKQHARRQQQSKQPPKGRAATQRAAAAKSRDISQVAEAAQHKHDESHDRVLSKGQARAAKLQETAGDLGATGRGNNKALIDFSKLNRRSLRQAIVLREILGPPVALRDQQVY